MKFASTALFESRGFKEFLIALAFCLFVAYSLLLGKAIGWVLPFSALALLAYFIVIFRSDIERANFYLLNFIIFSLPAPYLIKFMGKDALTLTTIMILFLFSVVGLSLIWKKGIFAQHGFLWVLPLFIFFSLIISLLLHPSPLESSLRNFIANISGLALYFIILAAIRSESELITLIKFALLGLSIQTGVTFLQVKYPSIGIKLTLLFGGRIESIYTISGEKMVRPGGLSGSYELMAEMFLIGAILSMGLIYQTKKYIYTIPLFANMAGIIFTKTRSSMFLLVAFLLFAAIVLKASKMDFRRTSLKIFLMICLGGIFLFALFPHQLQVFGERFLTYFSSSELLTPEALNREGVWQTAREFLSNPTAFGNGLFDVPSQYATVHNFHSLYLTLLYKVGIFGIVLHLVFWAALLGSSLKILIQKASSELWHLGFFLFSALLFMLIDEIKIEYLRNPHTIQFAWMVFAFLAVFIILSKQSPHTSSPPVPAPGV